jgi:hypothetical protein
VPSYALAQRLEGFKAGPAPGGMETDALRVVVIDRNEDSHLAFRGPGRGHVGAPHHVDRFGNNRAVVVARAARLTDPAGCQQVVLTHEPQHSAQRCADAADPQPSLRWPFHQLRWRNL